MQANWDRDALADIATGRMNFGPEEVERVRAEVERRGMQR